MKNGKTKRIKVLTISDHPFAPSGVGTQTKYVCDALMESEKFELVSLAGAIKHTNKEPSTVDPYGDRWKIFPVDGYGNQDIIRSVLRTEKPDILWFMTDPRFWGWLWQIENEVRRNVPMVYYHVWDNYPYPNYNKKKYESNDYIATISKVTDDIVKTVAPSVASQYIPHAVDLDVYKKHAKHIARSFRSDNFKAEKILGEKTIFFWNNRNARRKQSGSLIFWFKDFLDIVGHDKATLLMHTDPKDVHGQDLTAIIKELDLDKGQVLFSTEKVSAEVMSLMYNMVDCTINISDAEGFGLATLESLACETPIIANMTGGLQEQITDGDSVFGINLQPSSKAIIGSQDIPYIYEDRLSRDDVVNALLEMHNMGTKKRAALGKAGRKHVLKNYNFKQFKKSWVEFMLKIHDESGSWDTRKNYESFKLMEVGVKA